MASTSRRLLIIDQSFKDFEGHHYEYNAAVLGAARALGLDCMLATHQSFSDAELCGAPVVGRFRDAWNDAAVPGRAALRSIGGLLPQSARHAAVRLGADWLRRARPLEARPNLDFASRVAEVVSEQKLGPGDHVLIHTLSEGQLLGIAELLGDTRADFPRMHVVLRYEGGRLSTSAFARMPPAGARSIHLWTDTRQLADRYRALGADQIGVLPLPHLIPAEVAAQTHTTGPLTLGYLGGARSDKGFDLLPALARSLADDLLATHRARLLVQANFGISLEEPILARAKRELAALPAQWVQLVEHALDQGAFLNLLSSIDILLLPYRADVYQCRSSGLLIQAAIVGIPTVVPAGTWLSGEAPTGSAVVFSGPADLQRAVRMAIDGYASLSDAARGSAAKMRQRHSAAALVRSLIAVT